MKTGALLVLSAAICLAAASPATAVLPHEGNYTTRQMAGMVIGYLSTPAAQACAEARAAAETLLGQLVTHYGFDKDDFEEDSRFGKAYVAKGRRIAEADARAPGFCQELMSEIQEDTVELLPH